MDEKHQFKIIHSCEEEVYRIIDLTEPILVGITEFLKSEDETDKSVRVSYTKKIKAKEIIGAKVVGYGIFIFLDTDNMPPNMVLNDEYSVSILKQMAAFFKTEVIEKNPHIFEDYHVSSKSGGKTKDKYRWFKGWRLAVLIVLGLALIGFIVSLIVFPKFREDTLSVIEIIGGIPFMIIMFLAYLDDLLARR